MIATFADKGTEAIFHGGPMRLIRKYPTEVITRAVSKLDLLNGASHLKDLEAAPGNRLEALKGDLRGFHSVRVNDQWRVVFRWRGSDAHEVRLVDYH